MKDKYLCACSVCGHSVELKPSTYMQLGINKGFVTCSSCNTLLLVRIAESGCWMESQPWSSVYPDEEGGILQRKGVLY